MSINRGGALPPNPNNNNVNGAGAPPQPPQPPLPGPAANAPALHVQAPAATPLPTPVGSTSGEVSSDPQLSPRQLFVVNTSSVRERWIEVEEKLRCGDAASVHRMLDEGLVPCLVDGDGECLTVFYSFPESVFQNLRDIDLFDRFVDLFVQHRLQFKLYGLVIGSGNGILLKRLVQGGVPGWKQVSKELPELITSALSKGDPAQLEAFLRIWKEHCPTCSIDWYSLWPSQHTLPSPDIMAVLTREVRPDRFSDEALAAMFRLAAKSGNAEAVASLCDWLGEELARFADCDVWRRSHVTWSSDKLMTVAQSGFAQELKVFPLPQVPIAQKFQLAVFGPKLSRSVLGQMLLEQPVSSEALVSLVYRCAHAQPDSPSPLTAKDKLPGLIPISWQLFQHGFTPPLASTLAHSISTYMDSCPFQTGSSAYRLAFLACLNECLGPDAPKPSQDPLSLEQEIAIHAAVSESVVAQFGDPAAFFASALACVNKDGTADVGKLALVFGKGKGLPPAMVDQIAATLSAICAQVMARPLPTTEFHPGMTGADMLQALHDGIRQEVARILITRLPQEMGRTVAQRDWNKPGSSKGVDVFGKTTFESSAHVNYLATSVIRQYGGILAADLEGSVATVVAACRALPANAFDHLIEPESRAESDVESDSENGSSAEASDSSEQDE